MPPTTQQLSDPQVIAAVSRLELHAREVVEGVMSGMHQSPYHGFSVEFAQHREYTPGDEIRYVDWRVAGRSDRLYIKEFEEETNLKAYLLLDTSESMRYRGRRRERSKLDHAMIMAAGMAALIIQQRDQAGLVLFDDGVRKYVPPRATASHFTQLLEEMAAADSRPKSDLAGTFHDIAERIKRRGLVMIFSDLFTAAEEVLKGIRHFRYRGHEVLVFHVLDSDEIEFPFEDLTKFVGLELEPELLVDPRGLRDEYLRRFGQFEDELERGCREVRVDLVRCLTSEKPEETLSRYLSSRQGRTGR